MQAKRITNGNRDSYELTDLRPHEALLLLEAINNTVDSYTQPCVERTIFIRMGEALLEALNERFDNTPKPAPHVSKQNT